MANSKARRKLQLDKAQVGAAWQLLEKVVNKTPHKSDFQPVHKLAAHIDKLAGKTVAQFLELSEAVRKELQKAAELVDRKFRNTESLHGFLRHMVGVLKKSADFIAERGGHIAVFLVAILFPDQANNARVTYLYANTK